jgi:hypothetical protein
MDIISRKEAKEQGLKFYFTGKPCKHNHVVERHTVDGSCFVCREEHNRSETMKKHSRKKYKENIEKEQERSRQYRKNNPWYSRRYKQNNRDKVNANHARRKASKLQRTPAWADLEKIKSYYTLAKYFEFITLGIKYHVDHIVPLQGKNVCGLHVPDNLQVLRFDHNCSKNNQWNWETQSHE